MNKKSSNKNLHRASKAKKDEFYTQLVDIEKELKHYKDQFRNKVVYCNCDDPYESNFFKYFASKFNELKLKKLITTSYSGSPIIGGQISLFDMAGSKGKQPIKIEINKVPKSADGSMGLADVERLLKHDANVSTPLKGNGLTASVLAQAGDFRSDECIKLLKEADIVVTNPPFSLFREYAAQLVKNNKKFLILGNVNAITYIEVFKHIKENKVWLGYCNNRDKKFEVPNYYEGAEIVNGKKMKTVGAIWYTNLDVAKRNETLVLYKKYDPEKYPKYVNYNAIEVAKISDIPIDYGNEMGVPITFLDKYNPNQFEIVGSSKTLGNSMSEIAKKGTYTQGGPRFYLKINDGHYLRLYDRLVIKNKKVKK